MSNVPKTSASHPIRVDWLAALPWPGRVGLTFAPGKHQRGAATGVWERDLFVDLARLRTEFNADHLVCLLEDHELVDLHIESLPAAAKDLGLAFHRLPISDGDVPRNTAESAALVASVAGWAAAGENVVIHCKGGLGRAGTIGGCVLRTAGLDGAAALTALHGARGPSCPETEAQRRYIEEFVPPML